MGWDEMIPLTLRRSNVSSLWYGIGQIWEEVKNCICWHVRNGVNTNFWYDHWVGSDGRLVTFYNRSESPRPIAITDMTNANGRWDWERVSHFLPESILWKIAGIKPPSMQFGSDLPGWRWEQNCCSTTKSAYDALSAPSGPVVEFKWCPWCQVYVESLDHVLRTCPNASALWLSIVKLHRLHEFLTLSFRHWPGSNIAGSPRFAILWRIGCERLTKIVSRSLGCCSILMAELWAVYDSLMYAWSFGYSCVMLESDCKEAIEILQGKSNALRGSSLVLAIEDLVRRNWMVCSQHIGWNCNCVADGLAAMGRKSPIGVVEWHIIPSSLVSLVLYKAHEMYDCP
ncbi:hypothetical protein V6N12_027563 [Hibiscus sabdariffa]|uniref:RNase H type-1 domain-containing protein n=1 Tax=Hibiscus sabdariffa TaxID=183260 RepID=A0ABR2F377_9ROSI